MIGSGFIKDMINSTRGNRALVKSNETGTYNNFDREAYLTKPKKRKAPQYNQASKAYMKQLRNQLLADNLRTSRIRKLVLAGSVITGLILFSLLFL